MSRFETYVLKELNVIYVLLSHINRHTEVKGVEMLSLVRQIWTLLTKHDVICCLLIFRHIFGVNFHAEIEYASGLAIPNVLRSVHCYANPELILVQGFDVHLFYQKKEL